MTFLWGSAEKVTVQACSGWIENNWERRGGERVTFLGGLETLPFPAKFISCLTTKAF